MDYIPADHVVRLNKLIKLARCGKRMRNGEGDEVLPPDVFTALDMNGDSSLSLDEIDTVLGADAPHFVGPLRALEKNGTISKPDFDAWCTANPDDFKKLLSMLLEINEQVCPLMHCPLICLYLLGLNSGCDSARLSLALCSSTASLQTKLLRLRVV
jgi:hypothetical protein